MDLSLDMFAETPQVWCLANNVCLICHSKTQDERRGVASPEGRRESEESVLQELGGVERGEGSVVVEVEVGDEVVGGEVRRGGKLNSNTVGFWYYLLGSKSSNR